MDVHALVVERCEEPQPLDVVHVEMGEQHVDAVLRVARSGSSAAPAADAGAGVEHEHRLIVRPHLDAGGVAAVARGLGAGRRDRAARPPDRDPHHDGTSQKIATAPTMATRLAGQRERRDLDLPANVVAPDHREAAVRRPVLGAARS